VNDTRTDEPPPLASIVLHRRVLNRSRQLIDDASWRLFESHLPRASALRCIEQLNARLVTRLHPHELTGRAALAAYAAGRRAA
jgi:hypothetical protein